MRSTSSSGDHASDARLKTPTRGRWISQLVTLVTLVSLFSRTQGLDCSNHGQCPNEGTRASYCDTAASCWYCSWLTLSEPNYWSSCQSHDDAIVSHVARSLPPLSSPHTLHICTARGPTLRSIVDQHRDPRQGGPSSGAAERERALESREEVGPLCFPYVQLYLPYLLCICLSL